MNSTSTNASEPNKRARPCARQAAGRQHRQPGRDHAPPASAASTSRAPAKQTRPPAKIPNARDFSSPPLIAIHPLLYPPPARRRVLPAQTRTFAGSRAQNFCRYEVKKSLPGSRGGKSWRGQKCDRGRKRGGFGQKGSRLCGGLRRERRRCRSGRLYMERAGARVCVRGCGLRRGRQRWSIWRRVSFSWHHEIGQRESGTTMPRREIEKRNCLQSVGSSSIILSVPNRR